MFTTIDDKARGASYESALQKLKTLKTVLVGKAGKELEVLASSYAFPSLDVFKDYKSGEDDSVIMPAGVLEHKLEEFGFTGKVVDVKRGPLITRYEIQLDTGVRLSKIRSISEDLAIALMSDQIRILAPIPGTSLIGIEIANKHMDTVGMREAMIKAQESSYTLPIVVGVDTMGVPKIVDLSKMPHLLIAGQTGSGKSVGLSSIILSILYTQSPSDCQLIMVDPKRVEMVSYNRVPHLREPVIMEPEHATEMFEGLVTEMEDRYKILAEHQCRSIASYNKLRDVPKMPYIVVVVDEMADLMMTSGKELEKYIVRLAQLSRAVGIHLVLATQRPVVSVITGLIKSNMPSRISYQVASKMDSRVILDAGGAEKLLGRGDMLMHYPGSSELERFHGVWVSDEEIASACSSI